MSATEQQQRNLELVRGIYEASFAGDVNPLLESMDRDFEEQVPPVLPWGGIHRGQEVFVTKVMPRVAAAIDFGTMRLVSISADRDHVAALLTAKSAGGDEIWIAEHWTVRAGKVLAIRVFYFDTRPLEPR